MSGRPVAELEALVSVLDDLIDAMERLTNYLAIGDLDYGIGQVRRLRDTYLARLHDARRVGE